MGGKEEHRYHRYGLAGLLLATLVVATTAGAASVEPTPVEETRSLRCSDFDADWVGLKDDPPGNGALSDGVLSVEISNFDGTSFDWQSTSIFVIAVYVKSGRDASLLYEYASPGSAGDTGLSSGGDPPKDISHITFCYEPAAPPIPELGTLVLTTTGLVAIALVAARRRT